MVYSLYFKSVSPPPLSRGEACKGPMIEVDGTPRKLEVLDRRSIDFETWETRCSGKGWGSGPLKNLRCLSL